MEITVVNALLVESSDRVCDLSGKDQLMGPGEFTESYLEVPRERSILGVLGDNAEFVQARGVCHAVEEDHAFTALHPAVDLDLVW